MATTRQINAAIETVIETVATTLAQSIVSRLQARPATGTGTPRDTWFAMSNWIASNGKPFSGVVGQKVYDKGRRYGQKSSGVDTQAAKDAAASLGFGFRFPGVIYITNNVDYVAGLNDGASSQTKAGFVVRAIEAAIFRDLTRGIRARLRRP